MQHDAPTIGHRVAGAPSEGTVFINQQKVIKEDEIQQMRVALGTERSKQSVVDSVGANSRLLGHIQDDDKVG